jgi:hypothetical protein
LSDELESHGHRNTALPVHTLTNSSIVILYVLPPPQGSRIRSWPASTPSITTR